MNSSDMKLRLWNHFCNVALNQDSIIEICLNRGPMVVADTRLQHFVHLHFKS